MFEHCLFFNLAAFNRQIGKIWQAAFTPHGLSASHAYLLAAIAARPGATQKELSALLEFDASTIARFVDDLVDRKLARRRRNGREVQLSLTASGDAAARDINQTMDRLFKSMQERLGKGPFAALVEQLSAARAAIGKD